MQTQNAPQLLAPAWVAEIAAVRSPRAETVRPWPADVADIEDS